MMNTLKFVLLIILFASLYSVSYADVFLSIQEQGYLIFSGEIELPEAGIVKINDTNHNPHDVQARSVLNLVYIADQMDARFNISTLIYYSSFDAFYLKCLNLLYVNKCDNWMYKVDGESPGVGMDQFVLEDGDAVSLFFGAEEPLKGSFGGPILEWPKIDVSETLPPPIVVLEQVAVGEPLVEELIKDESLVSMKTTNNLPKKTRANIVEVDIPEEILEEKKDEPVGIGCIFWKLVAYFGYENKETTSEICI